MARYMDPTEEQKEQWEKMKENLDGPAKETATKLDPWTLYRLKDTGHRVYVYSIQDSGNLVVVVSAKYNLVKFERRVFDVKFDEMEECDLPGPDAPVGAELDQKAAMAWIKTQRPSTTVH